jgi:hypothetical protein
MYIGLHVKCPLFLSDFNETWIFWKDFRKHIQILNSMQILPVAAKMLHADRRTDARTDIMNLVIVDLAILLKRLNIVNIICRERPTNALNCMLLYLNDGSYIFRQNNAILREQLGSFLSDFNSQYGRRQVMETCSSRHVNNDVYNSVHLLVNLYIFDDARYKNRNC